MSKLALVLGLVYFCALSSNAQKKIGFACGLSSVDVYDERLDLKVFSGTTALWALDYESKKSNELHIDFLSRDLIPERKGLMSTKNKISFRQANIRFLKNYILHDTTIQNRWYAKWGYVLNLGGRYGIHELESKILPYDETLYSYQVSLSLGIHVGVGYILSSKNQIKCSLVAQLLNTGGNNPYSPHGSTYVYQTLIAPRFYDLYLPLIYSHSLSNRLNIEFQINAQYYRYYFQQENRILKLTAGLGFKLVL